jgi:hypothetical protein
MLLLHLLAEGVALAVKVLMPQHLAVQVVVERQTLLPLEQEPQVKVTQERLAWAVDTGKAAAEALVL